MKKSLITSIMMLTVMLAVAITSPNFVFQHKQATDEGIQVRFEITTSLNSDLLKKTMYAIEGVRDFAVLSERDNYLQLVLVDESVNEEIRAALLDMGSDIDLKYIVVTNKSFYQK